MSRKTASDYAAIAVAPFLIFLMIYALASFLSLVLYQGSYPSRIRWILLCFTMGSVAIARIAIEKDRAYSLGYAGALGLVTVLVMTTFVGNPVIPIVTVGVILVLSDRIVRDCTLIDDKQDSSDRGLLEFGSLAKGKKSGHQPGRTVLYLAIAALPMFGLGQFFLRGQSAVWGQAQFLLAVYLFAALSLLVTTSFLGLRRYLRQRRTEMPQEVSIAWMAGGLISIALILFLATLAPLPGQAIASFEFPDWMQPREDQSASRYGWGQEGTKQKDSTAKQITDAKAKEGAGENRPGGKPGQADTGQRKSGQPGKNSPGGGKSGSSSGKGQDSSSQGGQSKSGQSKGEQSKGGQSKGEQSKGGESKGGESKGEQSKGGQTKGGQSKGGQAKGRQSKGDQAQGERSQGDKSNAQNPSLDPRSSGGQPKPKSDPSGNDASKQNKPKQDASKQEAPKSKSPSGDKGSSQPNKSSAPSSSSWSVLLAIAGLFKLLILLGCLGFLAYFLHKNWAAIRAWWEGLFRRDQDAPAASATSDSAAATTQRSPPPPFASLADPFASQADPRATVLKTYAALESYGNEIGTLRGTDETPSEYQQRLAKHDANLAAHAAPVVDAYNRLIYGGQNAPIARDLPAAESLWRFMKTHPPVQPVVGPSTPHAVINTAVGSAAPSESVPHSRV